MTVLRGRNCSIQGVSQLFCQKDCGCRAYQNKQVCLINPYPQMCRLGTAAAQIFKENKNIKIVRKVSKLLFREAKKCVNLSLILRLVFRFYTSNTPFNLFSITFNMRNRSQEIRKQSCDIIKQKERIIELFCDRYLESTL